MRGRVGVLDGLHLVEHEEVEAPAAELLDPAAHDAVGRQRDSRPGVEACQLVAPVIEHRGWADHEHACAWIRQGHGANEGDGLMRLAETHVIAKEAAEAVLLEQPEPVVAGLLVAIEVHAERRG